MSNDPYKSPMAGGNVEPHRATLVLVLGILGFCCLPCGIVAWVLGNSDLKKMQAGQMDRSGENLTNIGKILGIVSVALAVIGIVLQVVLMVVGGGLAALNN